MKTYVIENWLGHFLVDDKIRPLENGYHIFTQQWTNFAPKAKHFISEDEANEYIFTYGMDKLRVKGLITVISLKG